MAYKNKEYFKQYRQENKEKIKEQCKEYYQENEEKIKEYIKEWRLINKEKLKEYSKQYYQGNKEKLKQYQKQYRVENEEDYKQHKKEYRLRNKEKIKEYGKQHRIENRERGRKYREKNREKVKAYNREYARQYYNKKRRTNLKYNLNDRMSSAINKSLKGNKAGRHWESLVGYTVKDLKKRLQSTMPEGYNWQDFLQGKLHIDHITAKKYYNFTKYEHIDFKNCWALSNLQLLPAEENLIKGAKLYKPFQPALKMELLSNP